MKPKVCTSIEQSYKLLELGLSSNTADMVWINLGYCNRLLPKDDVDVASYQIIQPAWSLSTLLSLMPYELQDNHFLTLDKEADEYCCCYEDVNGNSFTYFFAKDAVDAVFEMVVYLLEQGLIKKEE